MQHYAYPEPYGPHLPEHTDVMTAEQALEDVIGAVNDMDISLDDVANLFEDTRHRATAEDNLRSIQASAYFYGLDIPIPVELSGVWSAGWNEPGYLPNPDIVALFRNESEAQEYIDNERESDPDENLVFWVEYVPGDLNQTEVK